MTDENETTLRAYETGVQAFIEKTPRQPSAAVQAWLGTATAGLSSATRIFEIGSAYGRDAAYLKTKGFSVECSDAVDAFLTLLKEAGFPTQRFNVVTDDVPKGFDLILANAVLLHVTRADFERFLGEAFTALNPLGRLAFSLKRGAGEEWSAHKIGVPRYFCYWEEPAVAALLQKAGFAEWKIEATTDNGSSWLTIVAYKPTLITQ